MRTIILVRHAQYSRNPEKLTPLGRKQAHYAGTALKMFKADRLLSSTMPRAIETAGIVSKYVKLKSTKNSLYREAALPIQNRDFEKVYGTKTTVAGRKRLAAKEKKNALRADRAFERLFKKPEKKNETIILVAHGNIIRYWVCRALKIDVKKWLLMSIHQCSITSIRIDEEGAFKVLGFSDSGHIPFQSRTYM